VPASEEKELLRKEPFIMLLFSSEPQEQLMLRIEPREFAKMGQKWEIYLLLLQN
jgi:hypothetical protein